MMDFIAQDESTQESMRDRIVRDYEIAESDVAGVVFIAEAGYSECYEEGEWFLMRMPDGELRENEASHCSCYGFEGQWDPAHSSLEYLLSDHFKVPFSYDDKEEGTAKIKEWARDQVARAASAGG